MLLLNYIFIINFVRPTYYHVKIVPPGEQYKDRHERRRYEMHQIMEPPFCLYNNTAVVESSSKIRRNLFNNILIMIQYTASVFYVHAIF